MRKCTKCGKKTSQALLGEFDKCICDKEIIKKNAISKAKELYIQSKNLNTLIQVDGGVNEKTITDIAAAGADIFVAGSAIFGSNDYQKTISSFREKIAG